MEGANDLPSQEEFKTQDRTTVREGTECGPYRYSRDQKAKAAFGYS